jgi:hypothetical protein
MTVADTGLADVWPTAAIAGRGHDIRARFASNLSVGPCLLQTASFGSVAPNRVRLNRIGSAPLQFAVGLKLKSKAEHVMVDAEDALIAALKVKAERPEALIMYVRRQNRRGDARNPPRRRDS